ncbi:MAG: biopolymer transporter ExbD [Planctomycetes bacterium]|nr:biopolymer transporter ExbD [Planctomycetota bacterium]
MRYTRLHSRKPEGLTFNATPMVDVIFMLTIFFMLVTRFSSAEQIPMELPKPEHSQAKVPKGTDRIIVNCRPADPSDPDSFDVLYSIGPNRPEALSVIAERLKSMKQRTPEMTVVVRADRRLHYVHVRAVMRVVADCGIEMLNVVAHVSDD